MPFTVNMQISDINSQTNGPGKQQQFRNNDVRSQAFAEVSGVPIEIIFERFTCHEDLIIKGKIISVLLVQKSSFKRNIAFINCRFIDEVKLTNLKVELNLSFTKCKFDTNLNIYDVSVVGTLRISECSIKGCLSISALVCEKVTIEIVTADSVIIMSGAQVATSRKIEIEKCTILTSLEISNIDKCEYIGILGSRFNTCSLRHIKTEIKCRVQIKEIRLNELTFEGLDFNSDSEIKVEKSICSNLRFLNSKLTFTTVIFSSTIIDSQLDIVGINQKDSTFDISTSTVAKLVLGDELQEFILRGRQESPLLNARGAFRQRIATYKILKKMFRDEDQYNLEDLCFYRMKNEESKQIIADARLLQRVWAVSKYVINRGVFGWGVQIRNVVFFSMLIILLFGIFYYFKLDFFRSANKIDYMDVSISGPSAALFISIWSFFGMQSEVKFPLGNGPVFFFIPEFLSGTLMLTVIIGMMIRKLVR